MHNIIVTLRVEVSNGCLADLVRVLGGKETGRGSNFSAVFDRSPSGGEAFVQLDRNAKKNIHLEYTESELSDLAIRIGGPPLTSLSLHHRSDDESWSLVQLIALRILERWGGTVELDP